MQNIIKLKWAQLEQRERLVLGWGAFIVAAIIFYAFIWQPWHRAIEHMEQALQPRRESLVWMRQQAEIIEKGPARNSAANFKGMSESLLSVIETTARVSKVRESIQQMVPSSNGDEVRVVLEEANFNNWVRWIDVLIKDYGVTVKQLSAERDEDSPNVAEIRITFERV